MQAAEKILHDIYSKTTYSQVPIKQVGRIFYVNFLINPNKRQVCLLLVEFQKTVPNKQVGWKISN